MNTNVETNQEAVAVEAVNPVANASEIFVQTEDETDGEVIATLSQL